jgi:hypothetical protein
VSLRACVAQIVTYASTVTEVPSRAEEALSICGQSLLVAISVHRARLRQLLTHAVEALRTRILGAAVLNAIVAGATGNAVSDASATWLCGGHACRTYNGVICAYGTVLSKRTEL